jgi:hypothetical protein
VSFSEVAGSARPPDAVARSAHDLFRTPHRPCSVFQYKNQFTLGRCACSPRTPDIGDFVLNHAIKALSRAERRGLRYVEDQSEALPSLAFSLRRSEFIARYGSPLESLVRQAEALTSKADPKPRRRRDRHRDGIEIELGL